MESCLKIGGEYRHGLGALLYKMGKISTLLQATTQNTTTTHNNQHEPPPSYPSVALALSLNGQAVGATNQWRRCFLLFPQKAPMFRFGGAMAGFMFGSPKRDASKNREMGGALDLGGRRLMMAYNNQPRVRAEACGQESAWGDTVPAFGASN
jgi:hypothetical protein